MPAAPTPVETPPACVRLVGELFAAGPLAVRTLARLEAAAGAGHTGVAIEAAEADALRSAGLLGDDNGCTLRYDDGWLSTRRQWEHERRLARILARRAAAARPTTIAPAVLAAAFPDLPAARASGGIDWQRRAAETALARGLVLITGGPGTGKTTVAGRILALLAATAGTVPVAALAAPTGKAAARLAEAVTEAAGRAGLPAGEVGWSTTLHRLFHDRRLERAEVLIVDEVSMADAATLHRVLARLPETARVILMGDPDQLASVAPGRVLADLVAVAEGHPLRDATVRLRVNWRSQDAPELAALVARLQEGDDAAVPSLLATPTPQAHDDPATWIHRADLPTTPADLVQRLGDDHAAWIAGLLDTSDPAAALAALGRLRWLSVLRRGPWGSESLNHLADALVCRRHQRLPGPQGHYPGRPVLVTRNRPDLGLANGDLGLIGEDDEGGCVRIASADGLRTVPLHRLDGLEPAWFLTVHKAQGSQGRQVEVVGLPGDATPGQRALATREMAYTAITRAARRLRLWWPATGLATALGQREATQRRSGLAGHLTRER